MDGKEVVQRMFDEIINGQDLDAIDKYVAEDYVDHGPMGDVRGPEGFRAMVQAWISAFPDAHCEVTNLISEGDTAAWVVHTTGTHTGEGMGIPPTGRRIETVSANVGIVRDGKAVEHWAEQGMFATLQQLGVLPEMPAPQPVG